MTPFDIQWLITPRHSCLQIYVAFDDRMTFPLSFTSGICMTSVYVCYWTLLDCIFLFFFFKNLFWHTACWLHTAFLHLSFVWRLLWTVMNERDGFIRWKKRWNAIKSITLGNYFWSCKMKLHVESEDLRLEGMTWYQLSYSKDRNMIHLIYWQYWQGWFYVFVVEIFHPVVRIRQYQVIFNAFWCYKLFGYSINWISPVLNSVILSPNVII